MISGQRKDYKKTRTGLLQIIIIIITLTKLLLLLLLSLLLLLLLPSFWSQRWMGADCNCFLKRLAKKFSENNEEPCHIAITWIRTFLSFEIYFYLLSKL